MAPEATIIIESYTHGEGSGLDRVRKALDAATEMQGAHGDTEVLIADSSGDPALKDLLEESYPRARRVDAVGLGYDAAKMRAAKEAEGEYLLYLDGDCIPADGWMDEHLGALRAGAPATGGFTRYDEGFFGSVASIQDFGFMLPPGERELGCYAFNNSAFRRDLMLEFPLPEVPHRCGCYAHAQLLKRSGNAVRMVPAARVRHEIQPLFRERYRQGFDMVAAAWADPLIGDAKLLRFGLLAAPVFYLRAIKRDLTRLKAGRRWLDLSTVQAIAAVPVLVVFRLIDLAGIIRALGPGGKTSGVGL